MYYCIKDVLAVICLASLVANCVTLGGTLPAYIFESFIFSFEKTKTKTWELIIANIFFIYLKLKYNFFWISRMSSNALT